DVINYESVHKVEGVYDLVILDEAHHAISAIKKTSATWKKVYKKVKGLPIIYLSATPYAETVGQLYNQFKLSQWTPFKGYKTYYEFHNFFGISNKFKLHGRLIEKYDTFKLDMVLKQCDHLFSFKTRAEVGIAHEPQVNVVSVPLHPETLSKMKSWTDLQLVQFGEFMMEGDSDMKKRMVHYQMEGGTMKVSDYTSIILDHTEKVDYIKANYEEKEIAVMAHFVKKRELLQQALPEAIILSSDGDAEGVDLHRIGKLIVYSMSFKTSKHTQRTARQANHNRDKPILVDILVSDTPAIGRAVYDAVAIKKENFIKSSYERSIYG
ncbi:MAG: hypothetical protein DRH06_08240, partial [Deltaproteobacteria bacterium]